MRGCWVVFFFGEFFCFFTGTTSSSTISMLAGTRAGSKENQKTAYHAPLHHSLLLLGCGHWRAVTTLCAAGRAIRAARPARTRFKGGGGEAGDAAGCTGDVEAEARGVGKGGAG